VRIKRVSTFKKGLLSIPLDGWGARVPRTRFSYLIFSARTVSDRWHPVEKGVNQSESGHPYKNSAPASSARMTPSLSVSLLTAGETAGEIVVRNLMSAYHLNALNKHFTFLRYDDILVIGAVPVSRAESSGSWPSKGRHDKQ
jgi:hypothetical protein